MTQRKAWSAQEEDNIAWLARDAALSTKERAELLMELPPVRRAEEMQRSGVTTAMLKQALGLGSTEELDAMTDALTEAGRQRRQAPSAPERTYLDCLDGYGDYVRVGDWVSILTVVDEGTVSTLYAPEEPVEVRTIFQLIQSPSTTPYIEVRERSRADLLVFRLRSSPEGLWRREVTVVIPHEVGLIAPGVVRAVLQEFGWVLVMSVRGAPRQEQEAWSKRFGEEDVQLCVPYRADVLGYSRLLWTLVILPLAEREGRLLVELMASLLERSGYPREGKSFSR